MKLQVIGTGSQGNCYILRSGEDAIMLDAGLPIKRIVTAARGLRGVSACLITHEHGDHIKAARELAWLGVDVYATPGTLEAAKIDYGIARIHGAEYLKLLEVKGYTVLPFQTQHDAQQPCGFLILSRSTGETLLYATDTYYLRNTFPGVNYWLIECNYCDDTLAEMLDSGEIDTTMRNRLLVSHMSLDRLKMTLQANDLSQTRTIVLCHLSDARSDENRMIREVSQAVGCDTIAAHNGESIELELTPF